MIDMKNIYKKFDNKSIFSDAKLHVSKKTFVGIKGASGSGKTTLLSMIGLIDGFNGEYRLNGVITTKKNMKKQRINNISYVFQESYLIPYLSVRDNIVMALRNEKKKIDETKFNDIVEFLKIEDLLNQKSSTLSGGEAQRTAIGRALMSDKELILADEPTGNLDPENANNVMNIFKSLVVHFDKTIVLVTHSNVYDSLFDQIYYINEGKINVK